MFNGYEQVVLIGEGGVGRVYRAVRSSTGGIVAIKELREVPTASPAWHRAKRELEAMLRLKGHPYVVSVEEIFDGPSGPCLVMEYLDGGTLIDRVDQRGPLPVAELLLIGQQVTHALVAAHEMGVVHRDIKPQNLLVGSFGQVKVADFGIATLARGGTRTATSALTLAYASPEQLEDLPVGPPSDVYSFAVAMLHLATGRKPSIREMANRPREAIALASLHPAIAGVAAVLRDSLAESPDSRPSMSTVQQSFSAAAAALGPAALTRLPTAADPTVRSQPVRSLADASQHYPAPPTVVRPAAPPTIPQPALIAPATIPQTALVNPPSAPRRRHMVPILVAAAAATVLTVVGVIALGGNTDTKKPAAETTNTGGAADGASAATVPALGGQGSPLDTAAATQSDQPLAPAFELGYCRSDSSDHADVAAAVAYSNDGRYLVTVGYDGAAYVHDTTTNTPAGPVQVSSKRLYAVDFHPTNYYFATAGADGTARLWDAVSLTQVGSFVGHTDEVLWVAFSPSGDELVTASKDGTIRRWDVASQSQIGAPLVGHDDWVYSAEYSPDGGTVVSAGKDGTARVWDTNGSSRAFFTSSRFVHGASFSDDGNWIITSGGDAVARVFDATTLTEVNSLAAHPSTQPDGSKNFLITARFSPDASQVITTSQTGDIFVASWNGSSFTEVLHDSMGTAANFSVYSPDGGRYAVPFNDGSYLECGAQP